ncbi:MAG: epoxide hydrolase [Mycobacterium sp.]|nr:epoxide hydrolase [Mycobacterium sp.]
MPVNTRADDLPELAGVEHHFIDVGDGVTIHVADAGPADGPPVMLVHGFPQHWWEWHRLIGPLAADGYRVLCPDLRGAGWSSAPDDRYFKVDMAEDLAVVLDRLDVGPVWLVGHDWGGPPAYLLMVRHPQRVAGFYGVNTFAPSLTFELAALRHLWRFWYQIPMSLPVLGPRIIGDPRGRYLRMLMRWVGGGFTPADEDVAMYLQRMAEPARAVAGSLWYRTFQSREARRWLRGEYTVKVDVPVRWLLGLEDPVLGPPLIDAFDHDAAEHQLETVAGAGHWIVEQHPDLVLDRLRTLLSSSG